MNETKNPELHVNEEPTNDFVDVANGFAFAFIGFLLIFAIGVLIKEVM